MIKIPRNQHFIGGGEESFWLLVGVLYVISAVILLLACELLRCKAKGIFFYKDLIDCY